jgi:conjugal transfer mating pair stabilization protein TraG
MSFSIYLPGSIDFVVEVLVSVSAVSGSGYFGAAGAFGGIIGLIYALIKSVVGGTSLSFRSVFVAIIFFQAFFGTTSQVVLQNMITAETEVVDDVPFGIAAAGSILSRAGWQITEWAEQASSTPGLTENGLFHDIMTIRRVRAMPFMVPAASMSNTGGSDVVNLRASWNNYYQGCVRPYELQEDSSQIENIIRTSPSLIDALESGYNNALVLLRLPTAAGSFGCQDAHRELASYTKGTFYENYLTSNATRFGAQRGAIYSEVEQRVDNAIQNLTSGNIGWFTGTVGTAKDLILNTLLEHMLLQSLLETAQEAVNNPWTTMISDALKQRAAQWHGEAMMWTSTASDAGSFFFGLIFALTPVIALLIATGDFGVKMVFKYFSVLLWVVLWPFMTSIVNQFGHVTMIDEMQIDGALVTKLAVLDKLVAATAMLSLFIATGGTYALTNLAGSFQSGDHVDEKKPAPDTYNSTPLGNVSAPLTYDGEQGWRQTGLESALGSVNMGQSIGATASQARKNASTMQESFSHDVSQGFRSGLSADQRSAVADRLSNSAATQYSESDQVGYNLTNSMTEGMNFTESEKLATQAAVTGALAANASIGTPGKGALGSGASGSFDVGARLAKEAGLTGAKAEEFSKRLGANWSEMQNASSEYQEALARDLASNKETSIGAAFTDEQSEVLSNKAQQTVSASREAAVADQLSRNVGRTQDIPILSIASRVANDDSLMDQITIMAREQGMLDDLNQMSFRDAEQYGGRDKAFAAHAVDSLIDRYSSTGDLTGLHDVVSMISPAYDRQIGELTSTIAMPEKMGTVPSAGVSGVKETVENGFEEYRSDLTTGQAYVGNFDAGRADHDYHLEEKNTALNAEAELAMREAGIEIENRAVASQNSNVFTTAKAFHNPGAPDAPEDWYDDLNGMSRDLKQ